MSRTVLVPSAMDWHIGPRHICNAANADTVIAGVEFGILGGFQVETQSAELSDERGKLFANYDAKIKDQTNVWCRFL